MKKRMQKGDRGSIIQSLGKNLRVVLRFTKEDVDSLELWDKETFITICNTDLRALIDFLWTFRALWREE